MKSSVDLSSSGSDASTRLGCLFVVSWLMGIAADERGCGCWSRDTAATRRSGSSNALLQRRANQAVIGRRPQAWAVRSTEEPRVRHPLRGDPHRRTLPRCWRGGVCGSESAARLALLGDAPTANLGLTSIATSQECTQPVQSLVQQEFGVKILSNPRVEGWFAERANGNRAHRASGRISGEG